MLSRIFLAFLLVPLTELFVLINVHRYLKPEMGSGNAVLYILASLILSGFIGMRVIRNQGVRLFRQAQERLQQGALPNEDLLEGLLIVVSGVAFIFPGYISDVFGLLLLLPFIRHLLAKRVKIWLGRSMEKGNFRVYQQGSYQGGRAESAYSTRLQDQVDVIDVEAIDSQSSLKAP